MVDAGAGLIALRACVHWLCYCIVALLQATPSSERATLSSLSKRNRIPATFFITRLQNKAGSTCAHLRFTLLGAFERQSCHVNVICFCLGCCSSFQCVWDPAPMPETCVFWQRERGGGGVVTSTGVVITMRTLLSPDYTDQTPPKNTHTQIM